MSNQQNEEIINQETIEQLVQKEQQTEQLANQQAKNKTQAKTAKGHENFIVQGSILAIASIVVRLIGLFYRVPLTNILGNEGNGIYSNAYEIYSILLLISSYSLPLAVSKLVSATIAKGQYKNAYRYFQRALIFAIVVGAVFATGTYVFADFFAGTLLKSPLSSYALRVLAPCIFIVAVMGVFRGYFQGLGSTVPTAISQLIEGIVHAIVSVVGAKILFDIGLKSVERADEMSVAYGAAGGTLGTTVGAVFGLLVLVSLFLMYRPVAKRQMRKDHTGQLDTNGQIYKLLLVTIVPVILSTAVYNVSNVLDQGVFNNLMLYQGFTSREYNTMWGSFSGRYRLLTNVPVAIASALSASAVPSITAARVSGNKENMLQKIADSTRFTMVITIPCTVGLTVLAGPVLGLLWSTGNTEATTMLQIGSISVALYSLSTLSNGILQGIDRMRIPVRNALISLVLHLIVLVAVLQGLRWGIYAVVIANVFFSAVMCVLNARAIRKESGYKQEIKKTFVLPLVASFVMGAVAWGVQFGLAKVLPDRIATLVALVVAVAVYFVVLIKIGGVNEEELKRFPKGGLLVRIFKKVHLL